jgi:hypothetical protein
MELLILLACAFIGLQFGANVHSVTWGVICGVGVWVLMQTVIAVGDIRYSRQRRK